MFPAIDTFASGHLSVSDANEIYWEASVGIEAWLVSGQSWGTTLALAYAQAHPVRVTEIILAAVTTTTRSEVHWCTEQMRRVFPREWEQFASAIRNSICSSQHLSSITGRTRVSSVAKGSLLV